MENGVSVLSLLGIVFITLKLTGVITWSWLWVTVPFWGGIALFFTVIIILAILATILEDNML